MIEDRDSRIPHQHWDAILPGQEPVELYFSLPLTRAQIIKNFPKFAHASLEPAD